MTSTTSRGSVCLGRARLGRDWGQKWPGTGELEEDRVNWMGISDSQLELTDALFFQTHQQELMTDIFNLWPANT